MTRYFYNAKTGYCEPFEYGGCGGNKNNFQMLSDCTVTCVCKTEGRAQGEGTDWGRRWSSGDHTLVTPAQCLPP